jgi:hypothetical protein
MVQHGVRQHPLQPTVLVFQRPQPFRLGHLQTTERGLPLVEGRRADPVLAADLRRRYARLLLPQNRDDLFFRKRDRFIRPSPRWAGLYLPLVEFQGVTSRSSK